MRIQNPFRTGLLAGLGVLLALAIGAAVGQLATILTYVLAAMFLALGLDPLISALQRRRVPRWLAIAIVLILVLGVLTGLVFAVTPVIADQTSTLVKTISSGDFNALVARLQRQFGSVIPVEQLAGQATAFVQKNAAAIGGGVLQVSLGILGGLGGVVIVIILTIYFTASLDTFKRGLYLLVPMTKRQHFAAIAEQIFSSVGKYVIGQILLALVNGILSFVFLSIIGAQLPAVFAFVAFLGSLIPLVGTVSAAVVVFLGQLLLAAGSPPTWIAVAIYYLVYMQVEAYVLSPNIMNRAVKVPGVTVVLAALVGGTLLGILGALIAIPVAAAVLLILQQVVVPRQAEL